MRVIVPYVPPLAGLVTKALNRTGWTWEPHEMVGDDAYWTLLAGLWAQAETFVIVEHDVVIRPDSIDEFAACRSDWCVFRTPYFNGDNIGMGCVKFAGSLQRRIPSALAQVGEMSDDQHPRKHWCRIDGWLQPILRGDRVNACIHEPPVQHFHRVPSHGCMVIP